MDKIKVAILDANLNGMPLFLAKMTQRGSEINSLEDLLQLWRDNINKQPSKQLLSLPHSTIFRMCYLTVAIYGLSTKALLCLLAPNIVNLLIKIVHMLYQKD